MTTHRSSPNHRHWPFFGWIGLLLVALFWWINWGWTGLRTHWAFFPLWLGFTLTVEALIVWRQGHSLLTRSPRAFFWRFVVSAPTWWLFELFNERAHYWLYTPIESFTRLEYYAYCTLNFLVVVPAIFSTAELAGTFRWLKRLGQGPIVGRRQTTIWGFFIGGWLMLAAFLHWPQYGMAFVWMSLYFLLDPANFRLGQPALLQQTARGDWRLVLALWIGGLVSGFFWEMWNYYSSPKWLYEVPFVDFWYVFEMPLLGYLGYLPFALELFALTALITRWLPIPGILPEINETSGTQP